MATDEQTTKLATELATLIRSLEVDHPTLLPKLNAALKANKPAAKQQ